MRPVAIVTVTPCAIARAMMSFVRVVIRLSEVSSVPSRSSAMSLIAIAQSLSSGTGASAPMPST